MSGSAIRLTLKPTTDQCRECSICAMFLSSPLMVSIRALLRRRILSETVISWPFMLLLSFVISWMPSTKSLEKRFLQMYPLSPTNFPKIRSMKDLFLRGSLSSTLP